ncbi:MAG: hypothetical protein ABSB59_10145 [Streptosporangiaceae bacterium]
MPRQIITPDTSSRRGGGGGDGGDDERGQAAGTGEVGERAVGEFARYPQGLRLQRVPRGIEVLRRPPGPGDGPARVDGHDHQVARFERGLGVGRADQIGRDRPAAWPGRQVSLEPSRGSCAPRLLRGGG